MVLDDFTLRFHAADRGTLFDAVYPMGMSKRALGPFLPLGFIAEINPDVQRKPRFGGLGGGTGGTAEEWIERSIQAPSPGVRN